MAKAPATTAGTELEKEIPVSEEVLRALDEDMGKGVSTDAADNLVPLIYVLQPLSPQVLDGPAHMENARSGDFWLKNFHVPIIQGKVGIDFQPCVMYQKWTEWIPRAQGGGFIASYDYNGGKLPEGATRDDKVKNRPRYYFPDTGNDCVDTRYEAGFVWHDGNPYPYVIPFKSTGHKVSRSWMTKRTSLQRRVRGGSNTNNSNIWPAWSHLYHLTTIMQSNNQGQWYTIDVGEPMFYLSGFPEKPHREGLKIVGNDPNRAYMMGQALAEAFRSGRKMEAPEDAGIDEADRADAAGDPDKIPY
jgi:hypothetical protein